KRKKPASSPRAAAIKTPVTVRAGREAGAKRKGSIRRGQLDIPPLLLEGDTPPVSKISPSGPGERFALGPSQPAETPPAAPSLGELPESYGTRRLFLTARDPHWLYAAWDLTREQRLEYNRLSVDGHLVLRTYVNSVSGAPFVETHVHPESRSWFIHVGRGATRYVAELGYNGSESRWHTVATSAATLTPPDRLSEEVSVQFATLPPEVKFEEVVAVLRELIAENVPLVEAIQQLRAEGHTELPDLPALLVATPPLEENWTPAQTEALAQVITMDTARRVWMGSLEITELIRRQLQEEISSITAAELAQQRAAAALAGAIPSISSPLGREEARKRGAFWFNVNAELVIYGATERGAKLTIGGRAVALRPDGTFSFRFALPDGEYDLPVTAVAPDGEESRAAGLSFRRSTRYEGDVGTQAQDAQLKTPAPENVA
ncbi:MAG: DUF4912 domain-containing protein, partial [Verrucomicrobiales bacterium]|nr:DUF4912 domain-containing protein [Verrucomicrobiales bacterium]